MEASEQHLSSEAAYSPPLDLTAQHSQMYDTVDKCKEDLEAHENTSSVKMQLSEYPEGLLHLHRVQELCPHQKHS